MIDSLYVDALQVHRTDALSVQTIAGLGSPQPRSEATDRPERHGQRDYTRYYTGRVVTLTGFAKGATYADAWAAIEELQGALALGSDHVVKFTRSGLAYAERITGRVASELAFDLGALRRRIKWSVAIRCADPRIYADTPTSASYTPSTFTGGVVFPLVFPLAFAGDAAAVLTLTNGGNFATPPVWTIRGPARAFAIVNETTGDEIAFQGIELVAGDVLTVDVAARTVLLGGTSRPDLIDAALTTWFELGPGTSKIRLHGSGFSAASELSVSYRDARI